MSKDSDGPSSLSGLIKGASSSAWRSFLLLVWCIKCRLVEGGLRGEGTRSYFLSAFTSDTTLKRQDSQTRLVSSFDRSQESHDAFEIRQANVGDSLK